MPPEFEFVGFPSSPFGTQGYFDFCESVAIEATFAYDVWVGQKYDKLNNLGTCCDMGYPSYGKVERNMSRASMFLSLRRENLSTVL